MTTPTSADAAGTPSESVAAFVIPNLGTRRVKEIRETPEGTLVIFHDPVDHSGGDHDWKQDGQGFNNHDAPPMFDDPAANAAFPSHDKEAPHGHYQSFSCVCGETKTETCSEEAAAIGVHLSHQFVCSTCGLERNET
jgi:hypothetical protein